MNLVDVTKKFFESLLTKREEVLQKIQSKLTAEQFIIHFSKSIDYATKIDEEYTYKLAFQTLFKSLGGSTSNQYHRIINQTKQSIVDQIQQNEEDKVFLISDFMLDDSNPQLKRASLFEPQPMQYQKIQIREEFDQNVQKSINRKNPILENTIQLPKLRENPYRPEHQEKEKQELQIRVYPKKEEKMSEKKILSDLDSPEMKGKAESLINKELQELKSENIVVQVRYFSPSVIKDYKYDGYFLKDSMQQFIRTNLQNTSIAVSRVCQEVPILDHTVFVKSLDAGNYQFDPFCGCVQIKVKPSKNSSISSFQTTFKILGSDYEIKHTQVSKLEQWNKATMNLVAESNVEQIVNYVCEKRQEPQNTKAQLLKALRSNGGVKTIQDMYSFEKQDFNNLKIKPALIFQIQEVIQLIKECSKTQNNKDQKQEKLQCLKVANSHKVLRFLVYKNEGVKGVGQIAWLNMQNLQNAIKIIRSEIFNDQLLDELSSYFDQFALTPKGKTISFSRGLILFGPPGTGKTVLTQNLPNIMGFHLIQNGLSAADFNKSLVGESARMIRDLVNRANYSPYLLCSLGIDEVDGLVPDRKDKDQKNKAQGISMLLSVIGGNKDVYNLVYMTSTNYLKKIDEAIRRRLSGQYQVGRPNPKARSQIIKGRMDYLLKPQNSDLLDHMVEITANFTGAALGGLCNYLLKNLRKQDMKGQKPTLTTKQVRETAALIARQFSITLGVYTIPEIYMLQEDRKHILTENFLNNISNNIVLIKYDKGKQKYKMIHANKTVKYLKDKMVQYYQKEEQEFQLPHKHYSDYNCFHQYVSATFSQHKKVIYDSEYFEKADSYVKDIKRYLAQSSKRLKNKSAYTLLLIKQFGNSIKQSTAFQLNLLSINIPKLKILYYMSPQYDEKDFLTNYLPSWKIKESVNQSKIKVESRLKDKVPINSFDEPKYTGKIFVELNQDVKMAFELKPLASGESKIAFKFFLRSEDSNSPKDIIPELVNFFTKKEASYILMLDYELLLQNDAFQQKKQFEVLQQKMSQAKNYQKAAVIINLDSLVTISENASDSSMGRSTSYSIVNHNMYQILINYIKEFAKVSGKWGKWICVIMKNKELISMVKKELNWPSYPEDDQRKKEEELKQKKKKCARCCAYYTDQTNEDEPKCMQHPGKIIDQQNGIIQDTTNVKQLRARLLKAKKNEKDAKKGNQKDDENRFIYACCMKNINEPGETPYYHIDQSQVGTQEDQLQQEREALSEKWQQALQMLR